ncbi:MAG TPA: PQQ-dependent sugar dehydrogenase [Xanthobacteraceae bacterium]|jgi:glucose/arabinose dehydrogenase
MRISALACAVALVAIGSAPCHAQVFHSSAGDLALTTVARGLVHPWALAFLPDGRMLVTERPGRMRIVTKDGKLSPALAGVPKVFAAGQGGLLDVALDRSFAQNQTIYFCYAEPARGGARTALARAKLVDEGAPRLDAVEVIFRQQGPLSSGNHFGCRIAQTPDDDLFLTLGEHFTTRDQAQNLGNDLGKIVRIRPDGSVPPDNPFVGKSGAKPEIWSYGHRNPQGLAINPTSGKLWEQEHGPRGGDEVNLIEKGKNYGWPVIGYGIDYNGARIHASTHKPGMEQPLWYWVPSIAPSGMAFYTGDLFPAWRGNLFVGALAGELLVRLELDGDKVLKEERLLQGLRERIRDVRQGPDGALWLLTDNSAGRILRLAPAQ